ncbi:nuclease-related domain-containing protein [Streptomyces sp. NPDC001584]|uniref:nuclease-related domain-containing protein n=1 Tax=Streptomyces sp. NPDC001584 TaxID=3154521 RepID=UPI00331980C7
MSGDERGQTAQDRAEQTLRAGQPTGLLASLKALVGIRPEPSAQAVAEAGRWSAGAEGERRTAEQVRALADEGWFGLFDRHVPGLHSANVDIVLIAPDGTLITVDAKLWHRRAQVEAVDGRLVHGEKDYSGAIRSARLETDQIVGALHDALRRRGTIPMPEAIALIAVHNAPVAHSGFSLDGVRVVPAGQLLATLRNLPGPPDPELAAVVARAAMELLPRYTEGGPR